MNTTPPEQENTHMLEPTIFARDKSKMAKYVCATSNRTRERKTKKICVSVCCILSHNSSNQSVHILFLALFCLFVERTENNNNNSVTKQCETDSNVEMKSNMIETMGHRTTPVRWLRVHTHLFHVFACANSAHSQCDSDLNICVRRRDKKMNNE